MFELTMCNAVKIYDENKTNRKNLGNETAKY